MRMAAFGMTVRLPAAWDGRLYRRHASDGDETYPVLHAATFPLPNTRGDYGSGAVDVMGTDDVFVALREFDPSSADTALFATKGMPRLRPQDFSPHMLQRPMLGQSGCQRFFRLRGRPFCLYVVLGSHARRVPLARRANELIAGLEVA